MEAAHTVNERTPLLQSSATSSEHAQLLISATSNEQMSLDGSNISFVDQLSMDESGSSDEKMLHLGTETSSPKICPRTFVREINEVSVEEVVQALYSAWRRSRQPNREVTLEFFTPRDCYRMHLAWENVTRGRQCSFPRHKICEAVAEEIAKELFGGPPCYENDIGIDFHIHFTTEKNILRASLLSEWHMIDDDDDEDYGYITPIRYAESIFENSDELPPAVSKHRLRQVELYDKVREFCRRPTLHVLPNFLFFWPLSILVVGLKYMDCPMGHHLSHFLTLLGCVGCLAILVRMVLMYLRSLQDDFPFYLSWQWIYSKLIDFTFLIIFIVQAINFFAIDPASEPNLKQCVKNFYNAALLINYISIAFVPAYVLVYFIIICQQEFDFWHWIFRYL